jgi:site-specific DNA recombinase
VARVVITNGEVEIRYVIPTSPAAQTSSICHLRSDYRASVLPPQELAETGYTIRPPRPELPGQPRPHRHHQRVDPNESPT